MSRAEKLLARMRQTASGWKPGDFETLYRGFGFDSTAGSKHTKYWHPRFRHLWTTVPRADPLSRAYAAEAVELIDELHRLEGAHE